MSIKIYTRTGDEGQTGLFGGQRVSKDALRVEAYGVVDELNALIGHSISILGESALCPILLEIQHVLFDVGADLATPMEESNQKGSRIVKRLSSDKVYQLEVAIDELEERLLPLTKFILPGGTQGGSSLHVARTVGRRAERRCVTLAGVEDINSEVVRYLNRLSDFLFVAARYANKEAGLSDIYWIASAETETGSIFQ